jgi:hypothetical protein
MDYKILYILIEGNDDEWFFEHAIKPLLETKYQSIVLWQYAQKSTEKIQQLIRSIRRMKADYLFIGDIHDLPCVTAKREEILRRLSNIEAEKIRVVVKEIESWYLAGLNDKNAQNLTGTTFMATDEITKEKFDPLVPKKYDSRVAFMHQILNNFSIDEARDRNVSFRYFIEKMDF